MDPGWIYRLQVPEYRYRYIRDTISCHVEYWWYINHYIIGRLLQQLKGLHKCSALLKLFKLLNVSLRPMSYDIHPHSYVSCVGEKSLCSRVMAFLRHFFHRILSEIKILFNQPNTKDTKGSLPSPKRMNFRESSKRSLILPLFNCPTIWSLLFIFVFLCWSSSWRLGPI